MTYDGSSHVTDDDRSRLGGFGRFLFWFSPKSLPRSDRPPIPSLQTPPEQMVILLFLYIHTRKSKKIHTKKRKSPILPCQNHQKQGFGGGLGCSFRLVAQNFRLLVKIPNLLPFMSKNGTFNCEILHFSAKTPVFLCTFPKKDVFIGSISVGWWQANPTGADKLLRCPKRRFFVHTAQKQAPPHWLTVPTCLGIMCQVPDLTQFTSDVSSFKRGTHPCGAPHRLRAMHRGV